MTFGERQGERSLRSACRRVSRTRVSTGQSREKQSGVISYRIHQERVLAAFVVIYRRNATPESILMEMSDSGACDKILFVSNTPLYLLYVLEQDGTFVTIWIRCPARKWTRLVMEARVVREGEGICIRDRWGYFLFTIPWFIATLLHDHVGRVSGNQGLITLACGCDAVGLSKDDGGTQEVGLGRMRIVEAEMRSGDCVNVMQTSRDGWCSNQIV
ncbi:hypothetical protein Tco_0163324 [Tanacetum coccineum]